MEKPRIQDDLYYNVNQEWIDNAVIPDDRPTTGGFADLDKGVEELLINDLSNFVKEDKYPNNYIERACRLFAMAKDVKKRNKAGMKPALKYAKPILDLKNISNFNRKLKDLVLRNAPLPFELFVMADMKNTAKNIVYIQGPSTILPDTVYYADAMAAQRDALLGMWSNMARAVLAQSALSPEDQNLFIEDALKFDRIIAGLVKSAQEWSEYTNAYNMVSVRKVASMVKPIKFRKLLNDLTDNMEIEQVSIADPRFFKGFKTLFNEENFEMYKHWAYVNELLGSTNFLSEELREIGSSYRRALTGVAKISTPEKYAYGVANRFFGEPIGLFYGDKYFGQEAKKDVVDMVKSIINAYKARIARNDILDPSTREKAIKKLDTLVIKMGYPDKVDSFYDELVFDAKDNYFNAVMKLSEIQKRHMLNKLHEPTNRDLWAMPGNMVNACYSPLTNDITFPAAILQAPFYSIKQSRSQNLGGIGAVIGHEISHAFDNNGAKFDEFGNICNWWTKQDFKNFKKKTALMVKQFDGLTLPWGAVKAELTVSENIADNGGMAASLEVMSGLKDANYKDYFINWAKVWCMKGKPEYLQLLLNVDVHAPTVVRANIPPRNFPEWYEAFKVTKKDKMYIAPNKRLIIW